MWQEKGNRGRGRNAGAVLFLETEPENVHPLPFFLALTQNTKQEELFTLAFDTELCVPFLS